MTNDLIDEHGNKTKMTCDENKFINESKIIVDDILEELCDKIVVLNDRKDKENIKRNNRKTCIIYEDLYHSSNMRESLYSLEEYDEEYDENDNKICHHITDDFEPELTPSKIEAINVNVLDQTSPKLSSFKRRFSFNSFLRKDTKKSTDTRTLNATIKYHSAVDIRNDNKTKLTRKPSVIKKKLSDIQIDAGKFLKRSFSLKEILGKKKEKELTREKLCEMKNKEWAKSYQCLIESDTSVKYDDMSFINYDALNEVKYEVPSFKNSNLKRTQSLYVHVSAFRFTFFLKFRIKQKEGLK